MSNTETAPAELACGAEGTGARMQVLEPRAVPLGGPRAMTVRRTLPRRARSLIGAWCFLDHYGPDAVGDVGGMRVPGHPHTGLQTVSWLFSGMIEHRDTTGVHALVRPGELNLMTAGRGIAHSEYSTPDTATLHGAQLWIALPERDRFVAPGFEHHAPAVVDYQGARMAVFLGSLAGQSSPATTYTRLLGAEITVPAEAGLTLPVDPEFEHGVLVDTGTIRADGTTLRSRQLGYLPPGRDTVTLDAVGDEASRILLLGGEPFDEQIVMWWNFIGRNHEEIVSYRRQWQNQRAPRPDNGANRDRQLRFGTFPAAWSETLPAPPLPNARLAPREGPAHRR